MIEQSDPGPRSADDADGALIPELLTAAKSLQPQLTELRRTIHRHPELGNEEHQTAQLVRERLEALGLEVRSGLGPGGTGVVAVVPGQDAGQAIALRADLDALPIAEETGAPYASLRPGLMHACGHDAHCTMLIGAATLLVQGPRPPRRTVVLIFQPSEEREPLGARALVEEGVLDEPPVAAIFALHVTNDLQAGEIGIRYGPRNASADTLRLVVTGLSGHAARPYLGIDAIAAAAAVVQAVQSVVARRVNALQPAVVTFGRIEGGTAANIVADRVTLTGTMRCLHPETRAALPRLLADAADHAAATLGAQCHLEVEHGEPVLVNDDRLTGIAEAVAQTLVGTDAVHRQQQPSTGSEDFAFYLERVPGSQLALGISNPARGISSGLHTPTFDIDEAALPVGAALLAGVALKAAEVA